MSQLGDSDFVFYGVLIWLVSIIYILILSIKVKPTFVIRSSPLDVAERFRQIDRESTRNLSTISNHFNMILIIISISAIFLFIGVIETGIDGGYAQRLFITAIGLTLIISILYMALLYHLSASLSISGVMLKDIKYWLRGKRGTDPQMQHIPNDSWMDLLDYRILEYLEKHGDQTSYKLSSYLLTDCERVRQRVKILNEKGLIDQSNHYFYITVTGRRFLRGYVEYWELEDTENYSAS